MLPKLSLAEQIHNIPLAGLFLTRVSHFYTAYLQRDICMQFNLLQLPAAVGWLDGCLEQYAQLAAFLKLAANYLLLPLISNRRGFLSASKVTDRISPLRVWHKLITTLDNLEQQQPFLFLVANRHSWVNAVPAHVLFVCEEGGMVCLYLWSQLALFKMYNVHTLDKNESYFVTFS